jgi:hypothetical protein
MATRSCGLTWLDGAAIDQYGAAIVRFNLGRDVLASPVSLPAAAICPPGIVCGDKKPGLAIAAAERLGGGVLSRVASLRGF